MKKIIWSLFDSETAITQELNNDFYTVYSIGLPSSSSLTSNFIPVDLSKKNCFKKLDKLPKPDIVFASPPCETWVTVNIGNVRFYDRNFNEHNLYWQKNFKGNDYAPHHREFRLLGQKTAYYTYKIIERYSPESWFIENGATSLLFKYLNFYFNLEGFKNLTYYDNYNGDDFSLKPTIIYSNKKILLNKNKNKNNKNRIAMNSNLCDKIKKQIIGSGFLALKKTYAERSKVPIELYKHILETLEGKHQQTLF
jgi:hypothetical protein